MWPYGVIAITGSIAIILTIYERVKGHLEHRKRMVEIKQMFVDLEAERDNPSSPEGHQGLLPQPSSDTHTGH